MRATRYHIIYRKHAFQILSIAFEFAEYSLQHQLPNFAEVGRTPSSTISVSVFNIDALFTVLVGSCERAARWAAPASDERIQWILDVLVCNWIGTYLGACAPWAYAPSSNFTPPPHTQA